MTYLSNQFILERVRTVRNGCETVGKPRPAEIKVCKKKKANELMGRRESPLTLFEEGFNPEEQFLNYCFSWKLISSAGYYFDTEKLTSGYLFT